jgi:hypothetical protein
MDGLDDLCQGSMTWRLYSLEKQNALAREESIETHACHRWLHGKLADAVKAGRHADLWESMPFNTNSIHLS